MALTELNLNLLSSTQWQLLNEKGFFKTRSHFDLSRNKLATCSPEVIKAICLAFRSARSVNLSNNGFEDCAPEIWDAFCKTLKSLISNHSLSLFVEINNLDPIRQMQLQNLLKLDSLKAKCKKLFWQHADTLSPNLNRLTQELREELASDAALRMQRS